MKLRDQFDSDNSERQCFNSLLKINKFNLRGNEYIIEFHNSYCPEVASVILIFCILKSKLASSESREDINFETVKGIKRLQID